MAFNYRLAFVLLAFGATLAAAWTTPVNLGATVNSPSLDASASLGVYGGTTYLFFASDRSGGLGYTDIWYATGTPPNFGAPVHMGAAVNSSDRDGGRGYYDIWYTVLDNPAVAPDSLGRVKALFR